MYKLLAIDLDGTLLNSKGEVSHENRNAIKLAKEKGMEVVLCSGRITNSVQTISLDIGADNFLISGNGAELYDIQNEKILYDNYMNKETTLKLIKFCEENSIYYSVFSENSIIAKTLNYNVLVYNSENSRKEINKRTNINITKYIGLLTSVVSNKNEYLNNITSVQIPSTEYASGQMIDGIYYFVSDLEKAKSEMYKYIYEQ